MAFFVISLIVNVFVAGLLPLALLGRGVLMENSYGPDTVARRILACLYGTIALVSFAALISVPLFNTTEFMIHIALVLLPFQVIYKLGTRLVIKQSNPVVTANLIIAALHLLTLVTYASGRF